MSYTVGEIARYIRGEVVGDASLEVHGVSSIEEAREGCVVFAENAAYFQRAEASLASCIIAAKPPTHLAKDPDLGRSS